MGYSTETELRNNLSMCTSTTNLSSANVVQRIVQADLRIKVDLNKLINFDLVASTPSFLNLLSQYKTAELCLVYMYGTKRKIDENTDVDYWRKQYKELLDMIIYGTIELVDGAGTSIAKNQSDFANTAKDGIEPALGMDDFGDWINKTDIKDERPIL